MGKGIFTGGERGGVDVASSLGIFLERGKKVDRFAPFCCSFFGERKVKV